MRHLREKHNSLFAFGLMVALFVSASAPVVHVMLAFSTPWVSGDMQRYDLQPTPTTLIAYHAGHWGAATAGVLGALLLLGAAPALRWYVGVPVALLALALGYWNVVPITGDLIW